ncbi:MAG: hypothetical protein QGH53_06625 [Prochlorococcaceae cyanobacterium ETNP18_MAG_1]|nr:hypothetical protein [Prochlorococcaceae cyanobacterium ETNP18_MAG_1]
MSTAPQHADDMTLLQERLVVLRANNPGKFKGWLAGYGGARRQEDRHEAKHHNEQDSAAPAGGLSTSGAGC